MVKCGRILGNRVAVAFCMDRYQIRWGGVTQNIFIGIPVKAVIDGIMNCLIIEIYNAVNEFSFYI